MARQSSLDRLQEHIVPIQPSRTLVRRELGYFLKRLAQRLKDAGVPLVVIDANPDVRDEMEEMGILHVDGHASDDDVFCEAGIERARAVVACVDSDAENIFVTITARALRPDIEIV